MTDLHPAASHHLPAFITAPGESDYLLVIAGVLLVAAILAAGVFFLWLHSLPERMVHNKWQYDIVAVLCLLALFSHVHAFWVAALLLAFVKIPEFSLPDFQSPLRSIASSLDKLATAEGPPASTLPPASAPTKLNTDTPEAKEPKGGAKDA